VTFRRPEINTGVKGGVMMLVHRLHLELKWCKVYLMTKMRHVTGNVVSYTAVTIINLSLLQTLTLGAGIISFSSEFQYWHGHSWCKLR
jgi:hypothetical protein